jgi:hypothetical protein
LIIFAIWAVVIGRETFGSLRSNVWLIAFGIAASMCLGWCIIALIGRWSGPTGNHGE